MSGLAAVQFQSDWLEVLGSPFMRHALLGGSLVAIAAGLLGYFVITRQNAFAAHALAHIGFPGATGAILIGAPVTLGLAVFCVAGGVLIGLGIYRAFGGDGSSGIDWVRWIISIIVAAVLVMAASTITGRSNRAVR